MKYITEDPNDIRWMNNPDCAHENVRNAIRRMQGAGKWEEFLNIHMNEADGTVDCDSLYDYLRHESSEALEDVGLHEIQTTATVEEVITAWEKENAPTKVKRENGRPCATITCNQLDFETVDEDGDEWTETLYSDDVANLIDKNCNDGEWDDEDIEIAKFEAWIARK
jgi:hypothetical protein